MYSDKEQHLIDRILKASLELARMKEKNTYETFVKMNDKCRPHKLMENLFSISSKTIHGRNVWTLAPQQGRNELHVLFLHGGAYVTNITPAHWFFIGSMIQKLKCTVVVPDYPLAPENHVNDVFDMLLPVYEQLIERVGAFRIALMGDSAGGGMALALVQLLRKKKIDQPGKLYLLSPWLDVHMTNPGIRETDALDPILNVQGLIDCGVAYSGETDRSNYLVSPLYGSFEDLPDTSLYVGTHEVMLADARKFKSDAREAGLKLEYHEIKNLLHDGMLYPTPEGKDCRMMIFRSLKKDFS